MSDESTTHILELDDLPDSIKKKIADIVGRVEEPRHMPQQMAVDLTRKASDDAWACIQRTAGLAERTADQYLIGQMTLAALLMAFTDQCCAVTCASDEEMGAFIRKLMNKAIDDALALRKQASVRKGEIINDATTPSNIKDVPERR